MDKEKDSADHLGLSQADLEALFESSINQTLQDSDKTSPQKGGSSDPHFENEDSRKKNLATTGVFRGAKSSLRMKYEAEVSSIIKVHGDLESMRRKLGLSKRKIAQLLMVDPSAWTRWTRKDGEAPPHIYRALEWYLLLQEKHPEYKSALWLNAVATPSISEKELENIKKTVISQARESLDQMPTYIETESVDLSPLQRQLKKSQNQTKLLSQKVQWLIISQIILLSLLVVSLIF